MGVTDRRYWPLHVKKLWIQDAESYPKLFCLRWTVPLYTSRILSWKQFDLWLELLEHLPFSPDLAAHVFPPLEKVLKCRKFAFKEEVIEALKACLVCRARTNLFLLKGEGAFEIRCNKCSPVKGEYVEEKNTLIVKFCFFYSRLRIFENIIYE